jgi:hypothetical protein
MHYQLTGHDNVLRTKVLKEINEDFHQADKVNMAVQASVLGELVRCFKESDDVIRELASRAVLKLATTEYGRETLIHDKIVPEIKSLFDDREV